MAHPDHRWNLDDVVARAKQQGEKLGRSNLSKLRGEMTPLLSRATVYGLAAGLGVTPATVARAALRSWGIDTMSTEVTDAAETVRIDPSLGESQRRQLLALIAEMRAKEASVAEHAAQANTGDRREEHHVTQRLRGVVRDRAGFAGDALESERERG
jgi:hypothetical protein